ncbi:MAG: PadR family transcriptional regulator [Dermatophilaceae bacterium]|mgnify:CR=1 FL=1
MPRRQPLLEFAVLGLLHESPMHGYELRKRLNLALGPFRALSFGTLYPCLQALVADDRIAAAAPSPATGRRPRIVYDLTPSGRAYFAELAGRVDPEAYDDDAFALRVAFFGRTESSVRLRVLEGRRARLEERLATLRASSATRGRDTWAVAMHRHTEESLERDLRWIAELLAAERAAPAGRVGSLTDPNHPAYTPPRPRPQPTGTAGTH